MHLPFPRRLGPVVSALLVATLVAAPSTEAQAQTQAASAGNATQVLPIPTTTTTAPGAASPPSAPSSPVKSTTTTRPSKTTGTGVPSVPVGGPPTSTTTTVPGAPPPPPPDPDPILSQVDGDLSQLAAINDYKPAQALVGQAQGRVTAAGATLLSARQTLTADQTAQAQAAQGKAAADQKLRQIAIAAYIGVGFTSPGLGQPAQGNGDQGPGTVSTPDGLTGLDAIDAKEMLIVVGQHARQDHDEAVQSLNDAAKTTKSAGSTYRKDQAAVGAAEAQLLAAQQTLKEVTTAAMTPGAASATPLPNLDSSTSGKAAPTTTTTVASTTGAANGATPVSPPILGAPVLDASQLLAWWNTLNRKPNITVPIAQLINSYAAWGTKLGVRYDVAFAQSVIETGSFSFPSYGQLTAQNNNFAGIGACDTCATGWSFPSADVGVEAQLELLREYATDAPLPSGVQNVIGGTGVGGCCQTWIQLAGKWASSIVYGISIMTIYQQMLSWVIPQDELAVGLINPSTPAAKGPSLAPLPTPPKAKATPATTSAKKSH